MMKSKILTVLSMILISLSASLSMENDDNDNRNGVKIYLQDEDCVKLGAKFIPTELTINNKTLKPERGDQKWIWNLPGKQEREEVLPIKMEYNAEKVTTRWKRANNVVHGTMIKGEWVVVVDKANQKHGCIMKAWGLGVMFTGGLLLPPCLYYYCKKQELTVEEFATGYDTLIKDPKNKNLILKFVEKENGKYELKTTVCDDK